MQTGEAGLIRAWSEAKQCCGSFPKSSLASLPHLPPGMQPSKGGWAAGVHGTQEDLFCARAAVLPGGGFNSQAFSKGQGCAIAKK